MAWSLSGLSALPPVPVPLVPVPLVPVPLVPVPFVPVPGPVPPGSGRSVSGTPMTYGELRYSSIILASSHSAGHGDAGSNEYSGLRIHCPMLYVMSVPMSQNGGNTMIMIRNSIAFEIMRLAVPGCIMPVSLDSMTLDSPATMRTTTISPIPAYLISWYASNISLPVSRPSVMA